MAEKIRGLQWRNLRFNRTDLERLPECSGIYVLCAKPPEAPVAFQSIGLYNPVYIGQAKNLKRRVFGGHWKKPSVNINELRAHFNKGELSLWYALADADKMTDIEDAMLFCFWPSANRKIRMLGSVDLQGFDTVFAGKTAVYSDSRPAYYNQRR